MSQTGPVKGAIALGNNLAAHFSVTLIPLKWMETEEVEVGPNVNIIRRGKSESWASKFKFLNNYFQKEGGRENVFCISFCLSSDVMAFLLKEKATIISSVRGNLPKNYKYEYGWIGLAIAYIHLLCLRRFDMVFSMSKSMSQQLRKFGIRKIVNIGNFVDESDLRKYRTVKEEQSGALRFLFLGSLTNRKRVDLLITSFARLAGDFHIDIVGDGPLKERLIQFVKREDLKEKVTFHGHLSDPYYILQKSDFFILPSESEGVSRAALEALFFGVPCILRDVDANKELIQAGKNGFLFKTDKQLLPLLQRILDGHLNIVSGKNDQKYLLPHEFQQVNSISKIKKLITSWPV